jgi:RNA polymerase sigma-70 factor (ECF subfamily)
MSGGQANESGEFAAIPVGLDTSDVELLFDRIYEDYEPSVERWVRRLAGPAADVEDLVHDVFVIALRRRREFRGDAKLSTWLFRIAELVVRKRRARNRLRRFLDMLHRSDEEATSPPNPTPLEEVERRQRCARLYRALDRLPDKYRTAVILCDLEGTPAEDAAHMLGVTANAVWVRVHRGRAKLHAQLSSNKEGAAV